MGRPRPCVPGPLCPPGQQGGWWKGRGCKGSAAGPPGIARSPAPLSVWSVLQAAPGCSPVQRCVCQDQASHGVSVAVSAPALGRQPLPRFVSPCSCKLTPHSCPSRSSLWFSLCALFHPANRSLRVPRVAYCASILFQAPLCSPSHMACDAGRLGRLDRLDLLCKFVVPLPCCCPGPSLAPPPTVYVLSLCLPLCWPGDTQHSSGFDRNVGRSC